MLDGVRTQPGKPSSWAQSCKVILHIRQNKTPEEKNKPESMMNVHHNVFWNWITDTKNNEQQKDFFFSVIATEDEDERVRIYLKKAL